MQRKLYFMVNRYARQNHRRYNWGKFVRFLACIVVFATTYALILPAITMEKPVCKIEEHVHSETCYQKAVQEPKTSIVCTYESLGVHVHTEDCYDGDGNLQCGKADFLVHVHDASCVDASGTLLCQLPEIAEHIHTAECYEAVMPATEENHVHEDSCYTMIRGELTCQLAETEGHTHGAECYTRGELLCELEEQEGHSHDNGCYEAVQICELAEEEAHIHADGCYEQIPVLDCVPEPTQVLICTEPVAQRHIHNESCFVTEPIPEEALTCTLPEDETHTHSDRCYGTWELICGKEEHTHSLRCQSDPKADVENEAIWTAAFADTTLSGNWREDVLTIARSQLGYEESKRNYIVLEDGETIKGYTRYGAWYGIPYGDWCAMFVSFCLHYAGVEDMPINASCRNWIEVLTELELYHPAEAYTPQSGDLIFFDWDGNTIAEHVGIVAELIPATEEEAAKVKTIEGNTFRDDVSYREYYLNDVDILGYSELPERIPVYGCGFEEHTHTDACYDAEGSLFCELEEHSHTTLCQANLAELHPTDKADVIRVISMIENLPTADEIDERIAAFEAAGDFDGEEAWLTEAYQLVGETYREYYYLGENLQAYVTNAQKLLDLEYIWSTTPLISTIQSAAPTVSAYTSTKEFVEVNLYDYNSNINQWWYQDSKYPGFQWNGGAHAAYKSYNASADAGIENYTTNRRRVNSIDFGNSLITNYSYGSISDYGKSANATDVVGKGGAINAIDNGSYGVTNRPVGFSTGTEVLSRKLINGYPALTDGTSLSYLFGNESADTYDAVSKLNTSSIDGLFLQNKTTGAYTFNSRENHAQYSNNFFTRYDQFLTPNFIVYPFGNFLPLNSISDASKATQVGAFNRAGGMKDYVDSVIADLRAANTNPSDWKFGTRTQLRVMLDEYAESWNIEPLNGATWQHISPANAIRDYFMMPGDNPSNNDGFLTQEHLNRMYNIDWDEESNFFFGMDMKMQIIQPKNGYTGADTNGDGQPDYPMEFYFTGDDDIWIYIDDVLFLDLSGIHRHVGGKIDFVNGIVSYYHLDTENTGDVSSEPYATYSFAHLFRQAGWTEAQLDEVLKPIQNYNRPFKDYTVHKFNFYYLERGSGSSVCRMSFNFPLLRQNTISVQKELSVTDPAKNHMVGDPYFSFQIMKADANGNRTSTPFFGNGEAGAGVEYHVFDAATNELIRTATTEAYGIFKIKDGERAEFIGISENSGKYYIREILDKKFYGQYENIYVDGEVVTQADNVWEQYKGLVSPVKDFSDGTTLFTFENRVDATKLSYLTITKNVQGVSSDVEKTLEFDMNVELNGTLNGTEGWTPVPVGTPYTLYKTDAFMATGQRVKIEDRPDRVVTTEGIVTVPGGATAEIDNLLPGTTFRISETSDSAMGYTVNYGAFWGTDWIKSYDNRVEGTSPIYNASNTTDRTDSHVCVTVTNKLATAMVQIPATKTLTNGAHDPNATHTYSFTIDLVKVNDYDPSHYNTSYTETKEVQVTGGNPANFNFTMNYFANDYWGPTTLVYEIRENMPDELESTHDPTVFTATVSVTPRGNELTVFLKSLTKNGQAVTSADFVNTLLGDLSLEKIVEHNYPTEEESFDFTVWVGENANTPLKDTTLKLIKNGATAGTVNTGADGTVNLTGVQHGDRIVLKGIPLGSAWRITETNAEGYEVSWTKTDGSGTSNVAEGSISGGGMEVVFTNKAVYVYELPETGGMGTTLFYIFGAILMVGAAVLLITKKRMATAE